jgi:hypothetical protein
MSENIDMVIKDDITGEMIPMVLTLRKDGETWRNSAGSLHSINGRPSLIDTGRRQWHKHGYYHNETGPAVITEGDWNQLPEDKWFVEGREVPSCKEHSLKLYLCWIKREKEREEMKEFYTGARARFEGSWD